jgi:hypothetical protein
MSFPRRTFLKSGAIVSAAVLLKPRTFIFGKNSLANTPVNTVHSSSVDSVQSYTREMFEPYIGDVFRVRVGRRIVRLKLVALDDMQSAAHGITTGRIARTDCFSMRFHAPSPLPSKARIHHLNHHKLGSFDLYMSQSKEGGKFLQTAIVNHIA